MCQMLLTCVVGRYWIKIGSQSTGSAHGWLAGGPRFNPQYFQFKGPQAQSNVKGCHLRRLWTAAA